MKVFILIVLLGQILLNQTISKGLEFGLKKTFNKSGILETPFLKVNVSNNGTIHYNVKEFIIPHPAFSNNDSEYPIGTIYASGLWLAGKINGNFKSSRNMYHSDFIPGNIDEFKSDTALFSSNNPKYDVYFYYSDRYITELKKLLKSSDKDVQSFAQENLDRAIHSNSIWHMAVNQGASSEPLGDIVAFSIYHDWRLTQNGNDSDLNLRKPLGIQIRQTQYAYIEDSNLQNSLFTTFEIINRSDSTIVDMYLSYWNDADVGFYMYNYTGSDPNLDLVYTYNGNRIDPEYNSIGLTSPAVGTSLLNGFLVDSIGKKVIKRKIQNSSCFIYLNYYVNSSQLLENDVLLSNKFLKTASSANSIYKGQDPSLSSETYNLMKGLDNHGFLRDVQINAINMSLADSNSAKWMYHGIPEKNTGWISTSAADQQNLLSLGPIDFKPSNGLFNENDPGYQRITFVRTNSFGNSNLQSLANLRVDIKRIKEIYDSGVLTLPRIKKPKVDVHYENKSFLFSWDKASESYNYKGYKFQGYQIVQFKDKNALYNQNFKNVAVFDVKDGLSSYENDKNTNSETFLYGSDNDIQNHIKITKDLFIFDSLLINNTSYYFGLRAFAYNPNSKGLTKLIYSDWADGLINIKPHRNTIGEISEINNIDRLNVFLNNEIINDILAKIINPFELVNANYQIRLSEINVKKYHPGYLLTNNIIDTIPVGTRVWSLYKNDVLVSDVHQIPFSNYQSNFVAKRLYDGIEWSFSDSKSDFSSFLVTANGAGSLNPPEAAAFGNRSFPVLGALSENPTNNQQSNNARWVIHTRPNGQRNSYSHFVNNSILGRPNKWKNILGNDFEIRFTADSNYAYHRFTTGARQTIPFQVWNITKGYRMIVAVETIDSIDNGWELTTTDHEASIGNDDPTTDSFFIYEPNDKSFGQAGYNLWLNSSDFQFHGEEVIGDLVFVNWNGGIIGGPYNSTMPETGTVFKLTTHKPYLLTEVFSIQSTEGIVKNDLDLASVKIDAIKIVPNPYLGDYNPLNPSGKYIKFINLPAIYHLDNENQALEINIFSLNGEIVRKIKYQSDETEYQWNLKNDTGIQVSSGMYIAHFKFPNGKEKIEKFIVIHP